MKTGPIVRRALQFVALVTVAALGVWRFSDRTASEVEYAVTGNVRVIARLTPSHAYLAEYERSLMVLRGDGMKVSTTLFPDTGGYARSQLYAAPDGIFYFKGYFDVARIDATSGVVEAVSYPVPSGSKYLGAFDYVRNDGWKFLSATESAEQPLTATGG